MNPSVKRSTSALLASSLLLTIGRGATLPFMTIYLTRQYGMSVEAIGYALTIALTVGVVFSLGFGILADKFDKKRYMIVSILAFIAGFAAIPLVHSVTLVVFFFSLINCAYSVFSTVLKAWFADVLSVGEKARIFSLNYSFLNIGWTVGPPIGTWLVMYSLQLPFWLAAVCAAFPLVFIQFYVQRAVESGEEKVATVWQPSVLLKDKALFWFTLSGLLASYVGGSFATCISQYVLTVADDADFAQKVVSVVLPVNAIVVVSLQYFVGRKITASNIRPLMAIGTLCFLLGLGGFIFSGENLIYWGVAAAVFTIGEIIYAPGEYMLIDNIAPPGMKASYFSAQALGWLGAAANPMITGIILSTWPAWTLFAVMMLAIVLVWLMILRGMSVKAWDGALKTA
ncbi:MAG TPA: efflux MFS transporter YdeE [Scandinavium sp.]|jgi:MFS family permease|uniref:efflux MFS transporter YdeE n=1 Tax=Scandinavium sp. TaxID=2830653 RepID=UPI002E317215|nr:efflux MFS transporter YdeE [Scandinavium sp.]HEX4502624.1 efflux MFS transporter YdeE [Scandinavium sp.]